MKRHHQLLAVTFAIALASIARSAPPSEVLSPEDIAKAKVNIEILSKLSPPVQRFSRAIPVYQHKAEFQPQILVNGEKRLHFTISKSSIITGEAIPVIVKGYIRPGDQKIYLHDAKTGTDIPAAKHPLFAPPGKTNAKPSTPG